MGRAMAEIFLSMIMGMAENSAFSLGNSQDKCSMNEITEKANVTEKEILELLEKRIIRGKVIFGVPYIVYDTPYSVEKKLKDYKENK